MLPFQLDQMHTFYRLSKLQIENFTATPHPFFSFNMIRDVTVADIDECANSTDTCSPFAVCNNTIGEFNCSCIDGYSGDGFNCTGTCVSVFNCVRQWVMNKTLKDLKNNYSRYHREIIYVVPSFLSMIDYPAQDSSSLDCFYNALGY